MVEDADVVVLIGEVVVVCIGDFDVISAEVVVVGLRVVVVSTSQLNKLSEQM